MSSPVAVVGGGPAGLATSAALKRKGITSVVFDRAAEVGASWSGHYDRLHLHTTRGLSGLPGLRIPRSEGQWVSRDGVVRYLRAYAQHHDLDIHHGVKVEGFERVDGAWRVHTSEGESNASAVVVATGYNNRPILPHWPGRENFAGELLHAADYRNPEPYRGKDVLVVGSGNTGTEIAVDLLEGGAARVRVSIRRAPHVLRRSVLGTPTQVTGILMRHLPVPVVDRLSAVTQRVTVGDLTPFGLPRPTKGLLSRIVEDDAIPVLDVGFVDALKSGRLEVVGAVVGFEGTDVVLADEQRIEPDVVIAATGYAKALEELIPADLIDDVGRPIVHGPRTHPRLPDVYFIGFSNPISGNLRELAIDARRIARAIARTTEKGTDGA